MRKHLKFLLAGAMFFALSGVTLFAQSVDEVKAHVPFAFYVDNTLLPAGDYVARWVDEDNQALEIRNEDRGISVEVLYEDTDRTEPKTTSTFVFKVAGGKHFLSQVWEAGLTYGFQLEPSRVQARSLKTSGNQMSTKSIEGTKSRRG